MNGSFRLLHPQAGLLISLSRFIWEVDYSD